MLRGSVLLFVFAAVIFVQHDVARAYYNDSDVIELTDVPPPVTEPHDTGGQGGGGGGGEPTDGLQSSDNFTPGGGGSGGSGGTTGGGSGGSGAGSGTGGNANEEDVLETLLSNGAIDGLSSFGDDSILGNGPGSGAFTINGQKVREVLNGRTDLQDILSNWKNLRTTQGLAREYGLIAASTALSDANVEEISFSADAFEIKYRSRGYLLAVIPWTFPVRVTVIPQALEGSRAKVQLPWYRFFVREFFTVRGLTTDVENTLKAAVAEAGAAEDERAILFNAVASLLRQKVGTVGDSVILGGT
ncbi:MAG: hypothetical protein WA021_03735 [Minisyncoccia bacterium]